MVTVKIFRHKNHSIVGFDVSGHASAAPHGQDIVCAGISALTQAAVLGMDQYLKRQLKVDVSNGQLAAELVDTPDSYTDAVLETMLIGLTEIAKIYPKSVRILEHRR